MAPEMRHNGFRSSSSSASFEVNVIFPLESKWSRQNGDLFLLGGRPMIRIVKSFVLVADGTQIYINTLMDLDLNQ